MALDTLIKSTCRRATRRERFGCTSQLCNKRARPRASERNHRVPAVEISFADGLLHPLRSATLRSDRKSRAARAEPVGPGPEGNRVVVAVNLTHMPVRLVARLHVDLQRVSSAVCLRP